MNQELTEEYREASEDNYLDGFHLTDAQVSKLMVRRFWAHLKNRNYDALTALTEDFILEAHRVDWLTTIINSAEE